MISIPLVPRVALTHPLLSSPCPSPLFSSFSHRLPPTHTALHTRSLSDSSTPSLPLIPESLSRGELSVSLRFLLRNFPVIPPPSHPSSSRRCHPAHHHPSPSQCRRTRRSPKKREERSRLKYDPRLSCARGAVWICARSEIRATIRTTRIYRRWRRRWPRPHAAARVIYASTSIDVEVERPSRIREGEKEREEEREKIRERSDHTRSRLTLQSSGLGFRL